MYRHRYYIVAYAIQLKYDKPAKSDLYDVFLTSDLPPLVTRRLLHLWRKKQLILGCDESIKMGMGSFAWGFFDWTKTKTPVLSYSAPLHGNYDQSTPIRSELFGICACL